MNATDATAAVFGSLISLLLFAALYIWTALALSAVFRKSGVEPWKAWVPILNSVVLLQLAGLSPWLLLLALIPFLGWIPLLVVFAFAFYRLSVAFGFGLGMTVLAVLAVPVWASILGWGSARWVGWEQSGTGVRRSSEAAGLPPLPSFATGAQRSGDTSAFPPAPPAPAGASAFAPPASPSPAAPATIAPPTVPAPLASTPLAPAPPAPPAGAPAAAAAAATASGFAASADTHDGPARRADASRADGSHSDSVEAPGSTGARPAVAPSIGGWAPPPLPGRPGAATPDASVPGTSRADDGDPWQGFALDTTDHSDEVTGAFPGAPAPISAVPASPGASGAAAPMSAAGLRSASRDGSAAPRSAAADRSPAAHDPAAPPTGAPVRTPGGDGVSGPPVTRVPAAAADGPEPWAPTRAPAHEADAFPEASGPVSAVYGAPDGGAPRSARSSVSAFHAKPEIPDEDDILDQTIIARRKRSDWELVPPVGAPVALSADVVILGRRPSLDPEYPNAQLVAIQDGTVSKTHARLRLRDDRWYVTDLDSTNGVLFATVMGTEVEAPRGEEVEAGDRFLLGDAEVRLHRSDG